MTGDEITCENCGEVVGRREGEWVHILTYDLLLHPDVPGVGQRCWAGKHFFAFPNADDLNNEEDA